MRPQLTSLPSTGLKGKFCAKVRKAEPHEYGETTADATGEQEEPDVVQSERRE